MLKCTMPCVVRRLNAFQQTKMFHDFLTEALHEFEYALNECETKHSGVERRSYTHALFRRTLPVSASYSSSQYYRVEYV